MSIINHMSTSENQQKKIAWILLFFILLAAGWMRFQVVTFTTVDNTIRADATKYFLYAYNLVEYGTYSISSAGYKKNPSTLKPDGLVTPGYPLFLSFFIDRNFDNNSHYTILLFQALLSTLTVFLVYIFFSNLGYKIALTTALLVAFSPHLINMNVYLLTETLYLFFMILFFVLLKLAYNSKKTSIFILSGAVLGMATLTRPWIQGYLVLLIIFMLFYKTKFNLIKTHAFAIFIGFIVIFSPWLIRNIISLGALADPALANATLHHGMYPNMMYENRPETLGFPYRFDPMADQLGTSFAIWWQELKNRFSEQPGLYAQWYLYGKVLITLSWNIIAGAGDVFVYSVAQTPYTSSMIFKLSHQLMWLLHWPLVIMALIGMVLAWVPKIARQLSDGGRFTVQCVALLMIYFLVMHSIGAPFPRYSIPMRPFVYGLGIFTLILLFPKIYRTISKSR